MVIRVQNTTYHWQDFRLTEVHHAWSYYRDTKMIYPKTAWYIHRDQPWQHYVWVGLEWSATLALLYLAAWCINELP